MTLGPIPCEEHIGQCLDWGIHRTLSWPRPTGTPQGSWPVRSVGRPARSLVAVHRCRRLDILAAGNIPRFSGRQQFASAMAIEHLSPVSLDQGTQDVKHLILCLDCAHSVKGS